jgi:CO/xanthine dehydrogenase FAD-binding subunit
LAACGIASTPKRLTHAEDALIGQKMNQSVLDRAAKVAGQYVTAPDDTLATNAYRRHLLSGLLKDVVAQAAGLKAEVPT